MSEVPGSGAAGCDRRGARRGRRRARGRGAAPAAAARGPARSPRDSRWEPGDKDGDFCVVKTVSPAEFAGGRRSPPGRPHAPPARHGTSPRGPQPPPAHPGAATRHATLPHTHTAPSLRHGGETVPRPAAPPGHPPELLTCRGPSYRPPGAPSMASRRRRPAAGRTEGGTSRAGTTTATIKNRSTCAKEGGGVRSDTSARSGFWGTSTRRAGAGPPRPIGSRPGQREEPGHSPRPHAPRRCDSRPLGRGKGVFP